MTLEAQRDGVRNVSAFVGVGTRDVINLDLDAAKTMAHAATAMALSQERFHFILIKIVPCQ